MAYIEERINKDGTKSYRAEVRKKGFPHQYATFNSKEMAEKWCNQLEQNIDLLRSNEKLDTLKKSTNKISFEAIVKRYKSECIPNLCPAEQTKRMTNLNFWVEKFGNKSLDEITDADIKMVLDELSKTITRKKTPITPATMTRKLAALSHVFTICCMKWNFLKVNPCQYIQRPDSKGFRMKSYSNTLNKDEVLQWLKDKGIDEITLDKIKSSIQG